MPITPIDEPHLQNDTAYRFKYVSGFIGFGTEDVAAIHAAAAYLAPVVPTLVDAVYDKPFAYDATQRHFVPRQSGYDGPVPHDIESLSIDHPMIVFRKQHLAQYLTRLVTGQYDAAMMEYLDLVGRIHTLKAGSPALDVPLVQMTALLGFVAAALVRTIASLGLDRATTLRTLVAFKKLLWIQNDLITRHYQAAAGRLRARPINPGAAASHATAPVGPRPPPASRSAP